MKSHTSYLGDGKWENVDLHVYKPEGDGTLFKDITRQTLFKGMAIFRPKYAISK